MTMTVQEFKDKIREDVLADPTVYIQPDTLYRIGIQAFSAPESAEPEFTFAPDEKIQEYLDGNMNMMGGPCCIACVRIFGSENCVAPHHGPCNMC